jgi:hypothetical protein
MTVIPFAHRRPHSGAGPPMAAQTAATGTFCSPSGRVGNFTGAFRLERFVSRRGGIAAAGVFSGELTDADGSRIGMGSRRCIAAVEVIAGRTALLARLGPVDVNLLGFRVTMAEVTVDVTRSSADIRRGSRAGKPCQGLDQIPAFRPESNISARIAFPAARPRPFATPGCGRTPRSISWSES